MIGDLASPAAMIIPVASGLYVIVPRPIVITNLFLLISIPPRSVAAAAWVSKLVLVSLVVELWSEPLTLNAMWPSGPIPPRKNPMPPRERILFSYSAHHWSIRNIESCCSFSLSFSASLKRSVISTLFSGKIFLRFLLFANGISSELIKSAFFGLSPNPFI